MKEIARINILLDRVGKPCFSRLTEIYPQGAGKRGMTALLPTSDARIEQMLKVLGEYGFKPAHRGQPRQSNEFPFQIERSYESKDMERFPYVQPQYITDEECQFGEARLAEDGVVDLDPEYVKKPRDIGFGSAIILVSADVRQQMEKECLIGVAFGLTRLMGKTDPRYWRLTSKLLLPLITPPCEVRSFNEGIPFNGNLKKAWVVYEGYYAPAELHYRTSEIKQMEPFDIAVTRELLGQMGDGRVEVVSRRFFEFCQRHKLKLGWQPVHLEPD